MNYTLILDYRKRSRAVDRFSSVAMSYRKALAAARFQGLNASGDLKSRSIYLRRRFRAALYIVYVMI